MTAGLPVVADCTYGKCRTGQGANRDGIGYRAQWLAGFGVSSDYQP